MDKKIVHKRFMLIMITLSLFAFFIIKTVDNIILTQEQNRHIEHMERCHDISTPAIIKTQ